MTSAQEVAARIAKIRSIAPHVWADAVARAGPLSRYSGSLEFVLAICRAAGAEIGAGPYKMPAKPDRIPGEDDA